MSDQIRKKKYCRIKFRLISSMAIGSGENQYSDSDMMKNSYGAPYIPASAIAGVVRERLQEKDPDRIYFGRIDDKFRNDFQDDKQDNSSVDSIESRLIFYDGVMICDEKEDQSPSVEKNGTEQDETLSYRVTIRDSVALDEYKTAKKGAKFDREVLEPGVNFVTYVEQSFVENDDKDFIDLIEDEFLKGHIRFGAKTMRGYGDIEVTGVATREFQLDKEDDIKDWIVFDVDEFAWEDDEISKNKEEIDLGLDKKLVLDQELVLNLELVSGISIRRYTTEVSDDERSMPDAEQLTVRIGSKKGSREEYPVIPGTTWAGAFRSVMKKHGVEIEGKNCIFGFVAVKGMDQKAKSRISFSESVIRNSKSKVLSRNAIDRFSGGTKDSALFTEKIYYGGSTELRIGWNGKASMPQRERKALAAAITDLHIGLLAVGGETSVGRGIFKVQSVEIKDGNKTFDEMTDDTEKDTYPDYVKDFYDQISTMIEEVFGDEKSC